MADLKYPLTYSNGSVAMVEDPAISHVRHALETIEGERFLFPLFGIPILQWDRSILGAIAARIRIAIAPLTEKNLRIDVTQVIGGVLVRVWVGDEPEPLELILLQG